MFIIFMQTKPQTIEIDMLFNIFYFFVELFSKNCYI